VTKSILDHQGNKYIRTIYPAVLKDGLKVYAEPIQVDVYCVLEAFAITCPALQHATKKLLCCGIRGKGNKMEDLLGIEAAVARAIELEKQRQQVSEHTITEITSPIATGG
jgi:hypothetical protein